MLGDSSKTSARKVVLSFSGGKDSVFTLFNLINDPGYEVVMLMTTLDQDNRVLMQGFDGVLLEMQSKSIGIPLRKIKIQTVKNNKSVYSKQMKQELIKLKSSGVHCVAYGDIFLEDVRNFRKEKLYLVGLSAIFPLWSLSSEFIAREFIRNKFKAIITCINTKLVSKNWLGKDYNEEFIEYALSNKIDPCGENGEFHTFVYSGPVFKKEIKYELNLNEFIIHNEFYTCVLEAQ